MKILKNNNNNKGNGAGSGAELIHRWLQRGLTPDHWRYFVSGCTTEFLLGGDHRLLFRKQAECGFPLHLVDCTLSIQMLVAWQLAVLDLRLAHALALSLRYLCDPRNVPYGLT